MNKFKAVRSYRKGYNHTNDDLNSYLGKGYEIVIVSPFIKDGDTEYLEYILKAPKEEK